MADEILKYLGNPTAKDGVFIDAFCGTGVVASKAADFGWDIEVNDMMKNAVVVSESRLISKDEAPFVPFNGYENTLQILNNQSKEGFIWREYSPASLSYAQIERKYFTEENAKKIDGASKLIHEWHSAKFITDKESTLLLASLIYAVNNVANIAGTYGCFLSKWTRQALNEFKIEPLELRSNKVNYTVSSDDVFSIKCQPNDIVYLDPPYTKRQYASYYHILETIVEGDEPKVEGVSGLRPWKTKSSVFCYKTKALDAMTNLVLSLNADRVLISYSNDGHIFLDDLVTNLQCSGEVDVIELGSIGKYRPNPTASENGSQVTEYLIDFRKAN